MTKRIRDLEQNLRKWLIEPLQKIGATDAAEPLDLWTEIQKRLREQITLNVVKQQVFPSRHVTVSIPVRDTSERSRYEGAFAEDLLRQAVVSYLEEERAKPPVDLWVTVDLPDAAPDTKFTVAFDNQRNPRAASSATAAVPSRAPEARLRVLVGESPVQELTLSRHRVNFGRGEKIRDGERNVTRRNDLFFADVKNGVNEKVSRRHARLEYDEANQSYRLFRDQPDADLSIRRGGRVMDDIPLSGLGVLVQPGDVIRLGRAEVEYVEYVEPADTGGQDWD